MNYKSLNDLTLPELLSITLRETQPLIANQLLSHFGTLKDLASASEQEIKAIKGIGPCKAKQLLTALELGKRLYLAPPEKRAVIRTPADAYNLVQDMRYLDREHFRVINLNTKNHVLAIDTVSIGTLNSSLVHPRECFKNPLRRSSAAVILLHNHVSGDPEPSTEDKQISLRLVDAGKLLGIEVLDHIIIGDAKFVSLKEQGLM